MCKHRTFESLRKWITRLLIRIVPARASLCFSYVLLYIPIFKISKFTPMERKWRCQHIKKALWKCWRGGGGGFLRLVYAQDQRMAQRDLEWSPVPNKILIRKLCIESFIIGMLLSKFVSIMVSKIFFYLLLSHNEDTLCRRPAFCYADICFAKFMRKIWPRLHNIMIVTF